MIPLKLSLKNFLSYGDKLQTIDMSSYPLICLSGKNGHGKSGMLDAMTWALWGEARKILGASKADAGLMRLGQSLMIVVLEFAFGENIYRVKREFSNAYSKSYTTLDFEIFDESKQSFLSLTDKTIRYTQHKINDLLGIDFETFINSAFIKQGLSNEFSKKNPKDRKQILASILGLGKYDQLKTKAVECAKNYFDQKNILQKLQQYSLEEIEKKSNLKDAYSIEEKNLNQIDIQFKECSKELEIVENNKLLFLEKLQFLELQKQEKTKIQNEVSEYNQQLLDLVKQWRDLHSKLLALPDIEKLNQQRQQFFDQDVKLRVMQQEVFAMQEKILKLKEQYQLQISVLRNEIQQKLAVEKKQIDLKEMEKNNLEFSQTSFENLLIDIDKKIVSIQNFITQNSIIKDHKIKIASSIEAKKTNFEKRRAYYQLWVQKGNWLASQYKELSNKKNVILDTSEPACPLCEQVLTQKRKQFLGQKITKEEIFLIHQQSRISKILSKLKEILIKQNDEIKKDMAEFEIIIQKFHSYEENLVLLDGLQKERESLVSKLESCKKQVAEVLRVLEIDKDKFLKKEKSFELELSTNPTILQLTEGIKSLMSAKESLQYDSVKHQAIHVEIDKLQQKITELNKIKKEADFQDVRREKIHNLIKILKNKKGVLAIVEQHLKDYLNIRSSLDEQNLLCINIKKKIENLLFQKQQIFKNLGSLKAQLEKVESLKKESDMREGKVKELNNEILHYQHLSTIFGKDGLQALLIEEAIPEIEQEANQILSKITDNRSQVFIESLRDLKKGGVRETLDIQISDSSGIRPYEMFSGGEAFRIDFALRIAISKLLARRAGTALQTLIIDEGFGSQDEEGLNRLMDAIYAIQKDFAKIIVVSHLPVFKDNFPVHLIVEKTTTGSVVQVVERG